MSQLIVLLQIGAKTVKHFFTFLIALALSPQATLLAADPPVAKPAAKAAAKIQSGGRHCLPGEAVAIAP